MRTTHLLFIGAMTLFLAACGNGRSGYDASGSFEAVEIIVSAEANGKIMVLDITEGQHLQKGQAVGYIDSTQLYLQKMSLLANARGVRAQRPNIGTQTAVINEQIETLQNERARTQKLIAANAANQKQLDDINAQIDVLQRQLSAQTSTLEKNSAHISAQSSALEIQVAQMDDMLQKCTIAAPISGTILNKYSQAGELAAQGTPLFKIADLDTMVLRVYVTNDQIAQIRLNSSVKVFTDAGGDQMRQYEGTVSWISDKAEFTPKTIQTKNERANLVYAVKISVPNDGFLKIGMYGEVNFE